MGFAIIMTRIVVIAERIQSETTKHINKAFSFAIKICALEKFRLINSHP
jgi:hypothetical protein